MDGAEMEAWMAGLSSKGAGLFGGGLSFVNQSETCATTRILQVRLMGLEMADVSRNLKIAKEAAAGGHESLFPLLHQVVQKAKKLVRGTAYAGLTPVMFLWELTRGAGANHAHNYGRLMLCDNSARRWWSLEPGCDDGSHVCEHSMAQAHRRADSLWCLLTYLGYTPEFVRYFVHNEQAELPASLFAPCGDGAQLAVDCTALTPGEVNATQHRRVLTRAMLHQVDATVAKDRIGLVADLRKAAFAQAVAAGGASLASCLRDTVCCDHTPGAGSRVGAPSALDVALDGFSGQLPPVDDYRVRTECARCKLARVDAPEGRLLLCGRCRLVAYCSRDCQRAHWGSHKHVCHAPEAAGSESAPLLPVPA